MSPFLLFWSLILISVRINSGLVSDLVSNFKISGDVTSKPNQFTDKVYDSSNHQLISTNCKWFGDLFEMIDFDYFWTHNSATTKMGGMIQWLRETQHAGSVFRSSTDFHPSSKSHQVFANDVLMEFINV